MFWCVCVCVCVCVCFGGMCACACMSAGAQLHREVCLPQQRLLVPVTLFACTSEPKWDLLLCWKLSSRGTSSGSCRSGALVCYVKMLQDHNYEPLLRRQQHA